MADTLSMFILIELVTSLIISAICLLVHFRQHFRLQCINRHYTQPNIVSQLNKRISGFDVRSTTKVQSRLAPRTSIFSKDTLVHPEDAVQWCIRSIDEQEFDFFPHSFLWYQLFLIFLLSIIFAKFLLLENNLELISISELFGNITITSNVSIILTQSSFLHTDKSSLIDWMIIYGVLILTNWEALFVFYRYYSTKYTARYFNTVSNILIFKLFTVYAVSFILLFIAQIHFYYYLFPFIIVFMSLFIIVCSYRTAAILIGQFRQMESMLGNFESNREIQNAMSKSVYFMRNTSMASAVCCIIYLSVLLISYNICIVFYLPCIWSILCILFTLNFIRNRTFVKKICCCDKKSQKIKDVNRAKLFVHVTDKSSNQTSGTGTNQPNENKNDPTDNPYTKRPSKSATTATTTKTAVITIHHEFETDLDEQRPRTDFALGVLYDTDADEDASMNVSMNEHEDDHSYNVAGESGTMRVYPEVDGFIRKISPKYENELSRSMDCHSDNDSNITKESENRFGFNMLRNKKAKSHEPFNTAAFNKSASVKAVRFHMAPHLAPNQIEENASHRRVQSARPHMKQIVEHDAVTRSPSVSKSAEPAGLPSIENNMNNSNPVKKSSKLPTTQMNHRKSDSYHMGDGDSKQIRKRNNHKASRRTLSRRLVFSKLPNRIQKLPDRERHKVEEFANLSHMMSLHGFCEASRFFKFELQEIPEI